MKTILRVNESRDLFFQTVDSIEIIKHDEIKNYSDDYKKYHCDLGNTGNLVKVNFDHDIKSLFLDYELNSWSVDCATSGQIQERDFIATKQAFKHVDRINKAMDYRCLLNDVEVLKQLIKHVKVQAVFIEYAGFKKLYDLAAIKKSFNEIYYDIVNRREA